MQVTRLVLDLFVFFSFVVCGGCAPKGAKTYLPESYRGWACVTYGVVGAEPLPEEDGYQVVRIPPSGRLETSSRLRTSPTRNMYYYYNDSAEVWKADGEIKFGGGGTYTKIGVGWILDYTWYSTRDARDDYARYVQGRPSPTDDLSHCGPFDLPSP